jgi:predicted transcriptional regulator
MPKNRQKNLRLDPGEEKDLQRIAQYEGRSEQDVLRDSLRMYVRAVDERRQFLASVEQGWVESQAGLGEVVTAEDKFFESLRKELREKNAPT